MRAVTSGLKIPKSVTRKERWLFCYLRPAESVLSFKLQRSAFYAQGVRVCSPALPTLSESIRLFGTEKAMRGSCYPTEYAEALFHRMQCIVWDGNPHLGLSQYSWEDDSLLDYRAHGSFHAQPAPIVPDMIL